MTRSEDEEFDERALELAIQEGERAPAWVVDGTPVPPEDASEAALMAAQGLRRELDPAARARIVDLVVDTYLAGAPATAAPDAHVVRLPPPRRRWIWTLAPLAAAAALALVLWPGEEPSSAGDVPDSMTGRTSLRPAIRGDVSPDELHLASGGDFYLVCESGLDAVEVVSVQASREDKVRGLGFKQTSTDGKATELHVHADLEPGRWSVRCGVRTSAGRFAWIDPPEPLIVE
ncbi:hypothetical protein [Nannocystis pusilla]|uniref:hypothetical protein n=1 Tax=Nannocystis pusilla TaxID=889268 RepID=UPI003BF118F3